MQRTLKFVRYLRDFDWEPVVLTTRKGAYPNMDASLLKDVPADLRIYRTNSLNPFRYYAELTTKRPDQAVKLGSLEEGAPNRRERAARWVRANLFLPDARVGWAPFAIIKGKRIVVQEKIDALFSTGPPHSTHLIGWALHAGANVPWIADFRDPWIDIGYYHEMPRTKGALMVDAKLEKMVLCRASVVTTVSHSWKKLLAGKLMNGQENSVAVIHNGFDPEDYASTDGCECCHSHFLLTYVGSLYASRNPAVLWRALDLLRRKGEIPDLRVQLIGRVDELVLDALARYGLDDIASCQGYLPHGQAIAFMRRSAMLFFVIEPFKHDAGMIPGKLYEYLASGRPVLGIGPVGGDAAAILAETGTGKIFERENVEGVMNFIRIHYQTWLQGARGGDGGRQMLQPYSRRSQTKMLADLLTGLKS